ncbi:MAG: AAA family ATPase [Betaproteobacteria bacterium]|nr:AAA family ATPase [Betaproteobacteria bacterium]
MSESPSIPVRTLAPSELCRSCDPERFPFQTTDELEDLAQVLGQARAVDAIRFGVGIGRDGYNLFAMGPEGLGRHTIVRRHLEEQATRQATPADWCYVFNFETPHKPRALQLPAGRASGFKQDMARLVEDLRAGIPAAFESDEYRSRQRDIETEFSDRQDQAIGAIGERAKDQGIALVRTPAGFGFAPRHGEGVMSPDEFRKLPETEQKRLEGAITGFQEELERAIHDVPKWRREAQRKLRELNRQVTRTAVNGLIEELKAAWQPLPQVVEYLARVQEDVLDHAEVFRQPKDGEQPTLFGVPLSLPEVGESFLHRYQVNALIGHAADGGAPIVYEDHPTHDNLVGRIEHIAQMGALVTDFTLIKAGSFHRANGGYLILDALKVLTQPFAWEALKRALRSREIRIESLGQMLSLVSTVSLEPEPIPLDVKVVVVGQRLLYYLLHAYDPEFSELFKVAVDFEEDIGRRPDSDLLYARMIATLARREKLRPFDRRAVARVIEHGAREAGDAEKLSVQLRDISDLLRESDYWAGTAARGAVSGEDVQRAIDARTERADRVRDRLQEEILRGTLLIDTGGERAGQANGLSVVQLGGFSFGVPHRITARVRLGAGKVVDIEREAELGGPLHSKGVLILSGFLAGRYAANKPLSLAASLVFEQSYGGVEGDSASSAELYALLSALADAPLKQSLAVTGSVNQHGEVQAIGGVNEKIEGFFDICRARGLTGVQGVLIPASNVKHLMLRRDVVEAVAAGRFRIYPVETVDQGIEILTGVPAGSRGAGGQFPGGTLNFRVEQRLSEFAERIRAFGAAAGAKKPRRGGPRA